MDKVLRNQKRIPPAGLKGLPVTYSNLLYNGLAESTVMLKPSTLKLSRALLASATAAVSTTSWGCLLLLTTVITATIIPFFHVVIAN